MLKVKQADNPDFDFLRDDDRYYPFYQWYKESKRPPKPIAAKKPDVKKQPLGGLLDGYSSSSSSDDNDNKALKRPPTAEIITDEEIAQKARRLQRAKMMREHFQNKLNSSWRTTSRVADRSTSSTPALWRPLYDITILIELIET